MKTVERLLLICTIISITETSEIPFLTRNLSVPDNSYAIHLTAGDLLNASVSWAPAPAPAPDLDMDVYLYPSGVDLLGDGFIDGAWSQDLNPEILLTNITQTGDYFIRVDVYTSDTVANFTFIAIVNGEIRIQDTKLGANNQYNAAIIDFTVSNTCKGKMEFPGSPSDFYVYSPSANTSQLLNPTYNFTNTTSFQFDVTQSGIWHLVYMHEQSGNYTSQEVNIKTFTDNMCLGKPVDYLYFTGTAPSLVYQLTLGSGLLGAEVSWLDPDADFDLYLYSSTQDVTKREPSDEVTRDGYLEAAISTIDNPEILRYNLSAGQTVYLRVELYTQIISQFKLMLYLNESFVLMDTALAAPPEMPATIKHISTKNACRSVVQYYGPQSYQINVYAPDVPVNMNSTPTYTFSNITKFSFINTVPGKWTVAIMHNITSNITGPDFGQVELVVSTVQEAECKSTEIPFTTFASNYPSTVYPVPLNAGDQLNLTCTWATTDLDFDLYLYKEGMDFLSSDQMVDGADSTDQYIETLAHSVNESGTYYVRVELYTDIAVDSFKLIVKVNDEVVRTEYDSAINPSFPISIRQFNTTTDCFAAVEYTGPALPIMVFPPGSNTTTPPSYVFTSSTFEFPLEDSGVWTFALFHNITSATALTPFTLKVNTLTKKNCQNQCSGVKNLMRLAIGTSDVCIINCSHSSVQHLKVEDSAAITNCNCQPKYNYDRQRGQCFANCSQVFKSNGIQKPGVCSCIQSHSFDQQRGSCLLNCTSLPHSESSISNDLYTCKCKDNFTFVNTDEVCRIQCRLIEEALPRFYKDHECECNRGYFWNETLVKCKSKCGDGLKANDQQCDDGNLNDKDGCSSTCTTEVTGLIIGGSILAGVTVIALAVVGVVFAKSSAAAAAAAAAGAAAGGAAGGAASGQAVGLSSENIFKVNDPPFSSIE